MAGQQISPTLRLVRPLGQGAMGSVWVAEHLGLNTQVAVKFMTPAAAQDAVLVARFRREAAAAAQIKSPHVSQVFDHGVAADGSLYIVMELLEGEDLRRRITRLGRLSFREAAQIVSQTAKALGRAHQLGIIHRDIKPDNLFLLDLDGEPFVKVLDFGIAKQNVQGDPGMTESGSMLGTPYYMSPEQLLSSKHVDARADLWALGVVAYQMLTGKLPFTGETLGALAVAVSSGVLVAPSALRSGIPPAVDAWVTRALQRDPAARFASAREMAEALEAAVVGAEGGQGAMASEGDHEATSAPWVAAPEESAASRVTDGGAGKAADSTPHEIAEHRTQGRTLQGVVAAGAHARPKHRSLALVALSLGALTLVGAALLPGGPASIAEQVQQVPEGLIPAQGEPAAAATDPATTAAPVPSVSAAAAPVPSVSANADLSPPDTALSTGVAPAKTPAATNVNAVAAPVGWSGQPAGHADGAVTRPEGMSTKKPARPRRSPAGDGSDDVGF
ncbi:Serine-threonine protein kinase [Chondromyces apiculatus DSM 436]|uniref:non-specific serine/threonine protein kinase n=2 Tax=Chondromyces apiculatus TaxID=51 RepID=A0A017SXR8_9BACT|nr:Serine-threonine protein kinase [Chondromyces apiculatus DSM 436]